MRPERREIRQERRVIGENKAERWIELVVIRRVTIGDVSVTAIPASPVAHERTRQ